MTGKLQTLSLAAALSVAFMVPLYATAAEVNDFNGPWAKSTTAAGTADIVDLTGAGGNLENNAPLPTGAVKLTTTENADRADIFRSLGNPTVSEVFNEDINFSYSVFKEETTNAFAAPALKLGFSNSDFVGDDFVQLIFEPTWNVAGSEGASTAVPTGDWLDFDIGLDSGLFWNTGGFGQANSFGGPPLRTLSGWLGVFDAAFADATVTGLGIGLGSFNTDTVGYVDDVTASFNGQQVFAADFEPTQVPIPGTIVLMIAGLIGLGAVWRQRTI